MAQLRIRAWLRQLSRPAVMGVLNVTPDSFSDGGKYSRIDTALFHAEEMVRQGVDILDIGGESTRPGSATVDTDDELQRVMPVLEQCVANFDCPISIDTSKPQVMQTAVTAGAAMINDVYALQADHALETAASLQVPVCLMHMQGLPKTMQQNPNYNHVTSDVATFLQQRIDAACAAGIAREQILLDPGFGFGKQLGHNVQLLHDLPALVALGYPVLVGISRKSMLGEITGKAVEQRLAASISAATLATWLGAAVVRVHDVAETVDAVKLVAAVSAIKK